MINHIIFVFFAFILSEKLFDYLSLLLANLIFSSEKPKQIKINDELSPLRNEINEEEKRINAFRDELKTLLKDAEKVNTPNTFALYSKMQRKANLLRNKIEENENNLEKIKGQNETLKSEKVINHCDSINPTQNKSNTFNIQQKTKILGGVLHLVIKKHYYSINFYLNLVGNSFFHLYF